MSVLFTRYQKTAVFVHEKTLGKTQNNSFTNQCRPLFQTIVWCSSPESNSEDFYLGHELLKKSRCNEIVLNETEHD